jgi:hypothetical protein
MYKEMAAVDGSNNQIIEDSMHIDAAYEMVRHTMNLPFLFHENLIIN